MYKFVKNINTKKVEYLMLKQKDLKRATLIEACINRQCTVKQVANALGLSERRVKQIKKRLKKTVLNPFNMEIVVENLKIQYLMKLRKKY